METKDAHRRVRTRSSQPPIPAQAPHAAGSPCVLGARRGGRASPPAAAPSATLHLLQWPPRRPSAPVAPPAISSGHRLWPPRRPITPAGTPATCTGRPSTPECGPVPALALTRGRQHPPPRVRWALNLQRGQSSSVPRRRVEGCVSSEVSRVRIVGASVAPGPMLAHLGGLVRLVLPHCARPTTEAGSNRAEVYGSPQAPANM